MASEIIQKLKHLHSEYTLAGEPRNALLDQSEPLLLYLLSILRDEIPTLPNATLNEWNQFLQHLAPHGIAPLLYWKISHLPEDLQPPAEIKEKLQRKKVIAAEVKHVDEQVAAAPGKTPPPVETITPEQSPVEASAPVPAKDTAPEEKKIAESQSASTQGTLHKPEAKQDEKLEKKKKQTKQVAWKDGEAKRRVVKPRSSTPTGMEWRGRKDKRNKPASPNETQNIHVFTAPTEPMVHEVTVPETISV